MRFFRRPAGACRGHGTMWRQQAGLCSPPAALAADVRVWPCPALPVLQAPPGLGVPPGGADGLRPEGKGGAGAAAAQGPQAPGRLWRQDGADRLPGGALTGACWSAQQHGPRCTAQTPGQALPLAPTLGGCEYSQHARPLPAAGGAAGSWPPKCNPCHEKVSALVSGQGPGARGLFGIPSPAMMR